MKRPPALPVLCAAAALGLATAGLIPACDATPGALVRFETEIVPAPMPAAPGTGELDRLVLRGAEGDWEVRLLEARALVGPFYFFAPREVGGGLGTLGRILVPVARAHGGDDNLDGVRIRGELVEQVALDALDPTPRRFGPLLGEGGAIAQASVFLDRPRGELASPAGPTRGHHVWVRAEARQGARVLRFAAGLGERPGVLDTPLKRRVDDVPVRGAAALAEGSVVRITAYPAAWLRFVDLDGLAADAEAGRNGSVDGDGVFVVDARSAALAAMYLGVRDKEAFDVTVR
jgi:hypothetical protein